MRIPNRKFIILTIVLFVLAEFLSQAPSFSKGTRATVEASLLSRTQEPEPGAETVSLPAYVTTTSYQGIDRRTKLHTEVPERPNNKVTQYTVQKGDTPWSIAKKFDLKPQSILWGNEWLSAEAGNLAISATLNILPVDGVLHTVKEGENLEGIASRHSAKLENIINYVGNELPPMPPYELKPGQQIIVPGGRSPIVWQEPGPRVVAGLGRKSPGLYSGQLVNIGTGSFIWPIAPPIIITQNFWEGHPALDLDTYPRQPIFASDSGTVIFSGWDNYGFGNLVIVDHGNGYWTYYAHNTANLVSVGQGVVQGQQIAESGSTGNSTGDHIDFRIRVNGSSFVNPLGFLP